MTNKQPNDKDGLLELLKKLWLPLAGFIGAVTLIYNFYKLWLGDQAIMTYITAIGGMSVLIIALGWVALKKQVVEVDTIIHQINQTETKKKLIQPVYPPSYRRIAWSTLALIFMGMGVGGYILIQRRQAVTFAATHPVIIPAQATQDVQGILHISQTQQAEFIQNAQSTQRAQQALEEKLVVLIAAFDGPDNLYGLRNEIVESLNSDFSQDSQIEIITVSDLITPDMDPLDLQTLGKRYFADVIVWGWYRPTENPNITVHIESLKADNFFPLEKSTTLKPTITLSDLETFTFQQRAGRETSALLSFLVGYLQYRQGKYDEAIIRFNQAISNVQSEAIMIENLDDMFYFRAECKSNTFKFEDAIVDYEKVLELNTDYVQAYAGRGFAYDYVGQYELAINDMNKVIELNPKDPWGLTMRAYIYEQLEKNELALKDLNTAIEFDRDYAWAYAVRGKIYRNQGQYQLAIQDFDQSIKLSPNDLWLYAGRAEVYNHLRQYSLAIADLNKIIELDPEFVWAYIGRGSIYRELKEYDFALRDLNQSIQINPQLADAYNERGLVFHALGEYDRALEDYDKAIEINARFADAYRNRGMSYQKFNKSTEAEADFKKYEELTGEMP